MNVVYYSWNEKNLTNKYIINRHSDATEFVNLMLSNDEPSSWFPWTTNMILRGCFCVRINYVKRNQNWFTSSTSCCLYQLLPSKYYTICNCAKIFVQSTKKLCKLTKYEPGNKLLWLNKNLRYQLIWFWRCSRLNTTYTV